MGWANRPSGDVDLFTSWQRRAETFTRLTLARPEGGAEEKVELAVDWRAHDPVQLAVGPVLHSDDAIANKVCALFGRIGVRSHEPPPTTQPSG